MQTQGPQEKQGFCLQVWEGPLVQKEGFGHLTGILWVTQADRTPDIPLGA